MNGMAAMIVADELNENNLDVIPSVSSGTEDMVPEPVPSVSRTTSGSSSPHDDDDDQDANSCDDADDESYCYESDYEYIDEATDEEEESKTAAEEEVSPGLTGKRRSFSPTNESVYLNDVSTKSSRRKGNLKTTGLEDEEDDDDVPYKYFPPAFLQNHTAATLPPPHFLGEQICPLCNREEHTPVVDCAMITSWQGMSQDSVAGILSVPSSCVMACMIRRFNEPTEQPNRLDEAAADITTRMGRVMDQQRRLMEATMRRPTFRAVPNDPFHDDDDDDDAIEAAILMGMDPPPGDRFQARRMMPPHARMQMHRLAVRRRERAAAAFEGAASAPAAGAFGAASAPAAAATIGGEATSTTRPSAMAPAVAPGGRANAVPAPAVTLAREVTASTQESNDVAEEPSSRESIEVAAAVSTVAVRQVDELEATVPTATRLRESNEVAAAVSTVAIRQVDEWEATRPTATRLRESNEVAAAVSTVAIRQVDELEATRPTATLRESDGADADLPTVAMREADDEEPAVAPTAPSQESNAIDATVSTASLPGRNETAATAGVAVRVGCQAAAASSHFETNVRNIQNEHEAFLRLTVQENEATTSTDAATTEANNGATEANDGNWTCPICIDDEVAEEDRLSMDCGHAYCRDCWAQFLLTMLQAAREAGGRLNMSTSCPHDQCRQNITRSHVVEFAPHLLSQYDELALNSFVQTNSATLRWCPGPNCDHVLVNSRDAALGPHFASCQACNGRYCFQCGGGAHEPLPCNMGLRIDLTGDGPTNRTGNEPTNRAVDEPTNPFIDDEMDFAIGLRANLRDLIAGGPGLRRASKTDKKIRLCPQCKTPIEKNGGCNHMTCKCGHHFCWLCMADMNLQNAGHFCGREPRLPGTRRNANPLAMQGNRIDLDYLAETVQRPESNCDESVVNDIRERRRELQRYVHYYDRYVAHREGQMFAENQCHCLSVRADDFARTSSLQNGVETDFFQMANARLVASRRMLKYSYCYLYYKLDPSNLGSHISSSQEFEDSDCPADSAMSASLPTSLALFLDHQERLERMTERLSYLSENAVTRTDRQRVIDMINTLDRCMQAVAAMSLEELDSESKR